uniref:Uncharacterized protein n=1 Tax=Arundo donax TaxID=35708 RepID=A0A0A9G4F9_ARUDO
MMVVPLESYREINLWCLVCFTVHISFFSLYTFSSHMFLFSRVLRLHNAFHLINPSLLVEYSCFLGNVPLHGQSFNSLGLLFNYLMCIVPLV